MKIKTEEFRKAVKICSTTFRNNLPVEKVIRIFTIGEEVYFHSYNSDMQALYRIQGDMVEDIESIDILIATEKLQVIEKTAKAENVRIKMEQKEGETYPVFFIPNRRKLAYSLKDSIGFRAWEMEEEDAETGIKVTVNFDKLLPALEDHKKFIADTSYPQSQFQYMCYSKGYLFSTYDKATLQTTKVEDTIHNYKLLLSPTMIPLLKYINGERTLVITNSGLTMISQGGLVIVLHKNEDDSKFPEFTTEEWFNHWEHEKSVTFKREDLLNVMNSIAYFTKQDGQYNRFFFSIKNGKAIINVKGEDDVEEIIEVEKGTNELNHTKAFSHIALNDVLSVIDTEMVELSLKVDEDSEEVNCFSYYLRDVDNNIIKMISLMELNVD